ncbi:3-ketosphinganine reductase, catalyzes the second step in phytosphingosine synthesis [Lipomyces oligophaga]|uniref:3-ketosphinganine reductase, catalyzes the second step in phytosphingosine synthesis n=1 Tax=Lipomyces oligophaga TaxID=45792 RepID=UPI0034CD7A04
MHWNRGHFWNSGHFDVDRKLVVITGASQGLGLALAKKVFAKGASVVVVARRERKLQDAVRALEALRVNENQTARYVCADLASPAGAARVMEEIEAVPDHVLLCAGGATVKLLVDTTPEELVEGININYGASLYLAHAAMKAMSEVSPRPKYERTIMFCSSVTHYFPFIGYGPYAPLKSALRTLADIMRQELSPYNVSVPIVFAGNFQSEGFDKENLTKPTITRVIEGPSAAIPADDCAAIILKQLDNGTTMITTDLIGSLLGSLVLGGSPRSNYLLSVIMAIIFAIFTPLLQYFIVDRPIGQFFKGLKNNSPTKRND